MIWSIYHNRAQPTGSWEVCLRNYTKYKPFPFPENTHTHPDTLQFPRFPFPDRCAAIFILFDSDKALLLIAPEFQSSEILSPSCTYNPFPKLLSDLYPLESASQIPNQTKMWAVYVFSAGEATLVTKWIHFECCCCFSSIPEFATGSQTWKGEVRFVKGGWRTIKFYCPKHNLSIRKSLCGKGIFSTDGTRKTVALNWSCPISSLATRCGAEARRDFQWNIRLEMFVLFLGIVVNIYAEGVRGL